MRVKTPLKKLLKQAYKSFAVIAIIISWPALGEEMENTYFTWNDFKEAFGREMNISLGIYDSMKEGGLTDFDRSSFDFQYKSDSKEKLEKLSAFLLESYPYKMDYIKEIEGGWELSMTTNPISITEEIIMYWALDMAKRGYEFDAMLESYGAPYDPKNPDLPALSKEKEDEYFDKGVKEYNKGNLSGALMYWSYAIEINPKDPNSFYSRAIVKTELYTWKAAIRDYDKALEIAPDFVSALTNRGSTKDENGDHKGAIQDYNKVIELAEAGSDNKQMAFYNRGNSKYKLGDNKGACVDWKKAVDEGADYAQERFEKYCKIL
ncbi:tetratricopeptide repeat protein [Microbulbifer variabilis]|uniref:tetratricopeptide repeat protein n=1 Tax=Microbulbifer variabilis TaxID=266805 RepID=UPI00037E47E9|nr:hypothetical protein [Microbulbifer variabilis]